MKLRLNLLGSFQMSFLKTQRTNVTSRYLCFVSAALHLPLLKHQLA